MTKDQLQNQLANYREYFKRKWIKPYPTKGTKEWLSFHCDVLKGKQMVTEIEKFESEITLEQAKEIFK